MQEIGCKLRCTDSACRYFEDCGGGLTPAPVYDFPDEDECYTDHFQTRPDVRILIGPPDWKDFIDELDLDAKAAPHLGQPAVFPCYVVTSFLGGMWHHLFMDYSAVRYLEIIRKDMARNPLDYPWIENPVVVDMVPVDNTPDGRKSWRRRRVGGSARTLNASVEGEDSPESGDVK